MNILIVDDQPSNLKLLRAVLEGEGMDVNEAADGAEALATLTRTPAVDAIISDVAMPRMDGFRLCMEVRNHAQFSRVPFIAYTASYTSRRDEKLMRDLGADQFIRKPASPTVLVRTLVETVDAKRAAPASASHTVQPEPDLLWDYNHRLTAKLEEKNRVLAHKAGLLKEAEDELQLAHRRLNEIIEQSPAVVYVLAVDGDRVAPKMVSQNLTRLLGFEVAEALTHEWWLAQLHPGDTASALRSVAETVARGASRTEYRLRHKDGSIRWVDDHRRLIRDSQGRPAEIFGVWTDITDRKQAEAELEEQREQWQLLVERSSDGIIVVQDERVAFANPAMARIVAAPSADALCGRPVLDFVHPARQTRLRARMQRVLAGDGSLPHLKEKLSRLDGGTVEIEASSARIHFRGSPAALVNVRDITARKRTEQRLKLQHAVTVAIADSASLHDAMARIFQPLCSEMRWDIGELWTVDRPSKTLQCAEIWSPNGAGDTAFAAQSREIVFPPGAGMPGRVWQACEPLCCPNVESEQDCVRRDLAVKAGFRSWLGFPIKASGEVLGVVGFFSKVPQTPDREMMALLAGLGGQIGQFIERNQLTEQFRQAQKMEALGSLAGGIAHDFNNVLAAITGYGELAKLSAQGDPDQRDHLEGVLTGARRATALVKQILAFCRQQEQSRRPLHLKHAVREALRLLRAAVPAEVEFELNLREETPLVLADATQIHQVVMNLVTNAGHAMRGRCGRLTVELEACLVDAHLTRTTPGLRPGRYARLTVGDTGHGMDEATRQRIFEPFFTTKPAGEGTGLGLSVVHGIVRAHHGAIAVFSQPGRGTTFHIYLPADGAVREDPPAVAPEKPRGHGERVLVIDDEPSVAFVSQRTLEMLGYRVEAWTDPGAALAFIVENPAAFDLVITDLVMPSLSGTAIAQSVIAVRPDCPVIATTGNPAAVDPAVLHASGIREVLGKPLSVDELATLVHRALQKTSAA